MTQTKTSADRGSIPLESTTLEEKMTRELFHKIIRWALGFHGAIHIFETLLNIYEGAWMSAWVSLVAGLLMIAGACIDSGHHKHKIEDNSEEK